LDRGARDRPGCSECCPRAYSGSSSLGPGLPAWANLPSPPFVGPSRAGCSRRARVRKQAWAKNPGRRARPGRSELTLTVFNAGPRSRLLGEPGLSSGTRRGPASREAGPFSSILQFLLFSAKSVLFALFCSFRHFNAGNSPGRLFEEPAFSARSGCGEGGFLGSSGSPETVTFRSFLLFSSLSDSSDKAGEASGRARRRR